MGLDSRYSPVDMLIFASYWLNWSVTSQRNFSLKQLVNYCIYVECLSSNQFQPDAQLFDRYQIQRQQQP